MFEEIYMFSKGRWNLRAMLDDPEWLLDALIGHGFCRLDTRAIVRRAVLKFMGQAFERRKSLLRC